MSSCIRMPRWKVLCALLAAAVLVAACESSGPSPTATQSPAPSPAARPPTLTPSATNTALAPAVPVGQTALKTVREIVRELSPSVVHVQSEAVQLDRFNRPVPVGGVGTGEIISRDGHILTNNHVVEGARKVIVTLRDGRALEAKLIGGDPSTDLAVLKIDSDGLAPIKIGRSSELEVGDPVIAIGHALDLPGGPTVTGGLVSALDRSIDISPSITISNLIQTDAAINPGNSGGPLVNMKGEMVGINTAGVQAAEGIGFAIAVDPVLPLVRELIASGRIERGFLGISPTNLTQAIALRTGAPVKQGVLIVQVVPGAPAERAGLRPGAIIVGIGDRLVNKVSDLEAVLVLYRKGDKVRVEYYEGANKKSIEVTLAERPR